MLLPLLETELVNDTDTTVRRLGGFVIDLPGEGRGVQNFSLRLDDGEEARVAVSEAEGELAAIGALRSVSGTYATRARMDVAKISVSLNKEIPGRDGVVAIRIDVPL